MPNRRGMARFLSCVAMFALALPVRAGADIKASSRIYVTAFPCTTDSDGHRVPNPGTPIVTIRDITRHGDFTQNGTTPMITVTRSDADESDFHFNISPGSYDVFVRFPNFGRLIASRNGPLAVSAGYDRHIFIAGCGIADWHATGAIAGSFPVKSVVISVLVFEHPMKCGDDFRALNQTTLKPLFKFHTWDAVIDGGAYYANFYGYGKQDRTIALLFSAALFT
jgi:hypothetical protein